MPRGINPNNPSVMLRLSLDRKMNLTNLANKNGCDTISQFVSRIADGQLVVIDKVAAVLLEHIISERNNK